MGFRRVLKPSGVFVSVTFAQPHFRRPLLLGDPAYDWGWYQAVFGPPGGFQYWLYALQRGTRSLGDIPDHVFSASGTAHKSSADAETPMHSHMDSEDYLLAIDL